MKLSSKRVIKASEVEALRSKADVGKSGCLPCCDEGASEVAATSELDDLRESIEKELEQVRIKAEEDAAAIIKSAEKEAEAILAEARSTAAELREEQAKLGFQEGFKKGEEQGYQKGLIEGKREAEEAVRQEWTSLLQRLTDTVSAAVTVRDLALERSEEDILKLSLAVAEKIIKRSISYDMSCTVGVVKAALERVSGGTGVRVRVNPDLVMAMEENREWLSSVKGIEKLEFVEDPNVEPGGCVVETDFGRIDGRLDTRISEIASALMEVLENDQN